MQEKIAIVGDGRLGRALASALRAPAPHGRGYAGAGAEVVLLCVPDVQIAAAAAAAFSHRLTLESAAARVAATAAIGRASCRERV